MYAILFLLLLSALRDSFRGRATLQLELIAVRHQPATMKRTARRPSLRPADRLLWVLLSRLLPNWRDVLVIVQPETVIGWHRKGFRLYRTWKSRRRGGGRPAMPRDVRALISRMSRENPLWGAPRIHGELLKLGIEVSEATVSKYLARLPKPPSKDVADIPGQPCEGSRVDRFLRPADRHVPASHGLHRSAPRTQADRPLRRDGTPNCGMGGAADHRSLSMG